MEKELPTELQVMAMSTLLTYVIHVLSDEQKTALRRMVSSKPIEVPAEGATPELMNYMHSMNRYIQDIVEQTFKAAE
ncbi:hypothetical protein [Rahnella sp. NRRL B-41462]|uniref:hypothetical protein n=1 Tax=Rahnella sp. NRRL B-41462 TaxID=1610579 RepID=UPI000DD2C7B7|nr:hypothetical protein [Rahnella sp. NRRL B-41462]